VILLFQVAEWSVEENNPDPVLNGVDSRFGVFPFDPESGGIRDPVDWNPHIRIFRFLADDSRTPSDTRNAKPLLEKIVK
jgi:hypothetical protein